MQDQQNGYIYEIASPLKLGVADYRDQALIVWRHGNDKEKAPQLRVVPTEVLSEALWNAGLLLSGTEETTP